MQIKWNWYVFKPGNILVVYLVEEFLLNIGVVGASVHNNIVGTITLLKRKFKYC